MLSPSSRATTCCSNWEGKTIFNMNGLCSLAYIFYWHESSSSSWKNKSSKGQLFNVNQLECSFHLHWICGPKLNCVSYYTPAVCTDKCNYIKRIERGQHNFISGTSGWIIENHKKWYHLDQLQSECCQLSEGTLGWWCPYLRVRVLFIWTSLGNWELGTNICESQS